MARDRHAQATPPGESVMAGGGYYSRHSEAQDAAAAPGLALFGRAAQQVPVSKENPVLIEDFGCAGGRNELEPIRVAIAGVRERAPAVPIMLVHTDLPSNDFTSLFQAVEQSRESYLIGQNDVFAYAAGRSLYGPIFPDAALTLGWTAITVHWLSTMPCVIPDQIFPTSPKDRRGKHSEPSPDATGRRSCASGSGSFGPAARSW